MLNRWSRLSQSDSDDVGRSCSRLERIERERGIQMIQMDVSPMITRTNNKWLIAQRNFYGFSAPIRIAPNRFQKHIYHVLWLHFDYYCGDLTASLSLSLSRATRRIHWINSSMACSCENSISTLHITYSPHGEQKNMNRAGQWKAMRAKATTRGGKESETSMNCHSNGNLSWYQSNYIHIPHSHWRWMRRSELQIAIIRAYHFGTS